MDSHEYSEELQLVLAQRFGKEQLERSGQVEIAHGHTARCDQQMSRHGRRGVQELDVMLAEARRGPAPRSGRNEPNAVERISVGLPILASHRQKRTPILVDHEIENI